MRLTCPNCGAQYEVPDEVIPESGRDVQCSNCGDTWFQRHPSDPMAAAEAEAEATAQDDALYDSDDSDDAGDDLARDDGMRDHAAPAPDGATAETGADPEVAADAEDEAFDIPEPSTSDTYEEDDIDNAPMGGAVAATARRGLDPDVAQVLREEAEREVAARAREADSIETQPDLGLGEPDSEAARREREARQRMARMRGMPDPEIDSAASRRDLLPDIEEINSSLRSTSDRRDREPAEAEEAPEVVKRQRRGFRTGFSFMLLLFAVLALVYVFAPQIAESVPALADPVADYVAAVDSGRLWLDRQVGDLMIWLEALAGAPVE